MYYFVYGFLYLLSLLPFFVWYAISDFAAFLLFRVFKYRRSIVLKNLQVAFPEKTEEERLSIAKKFYNNLTDTFAETVKMLSLSKKEIARRSLINLNEVNDMAAEGKNIQLHSGHQMNWEYANFALMRQLKVPLIGVYMKLGNKIFEKLLHTMRSRSGVQLVAAQDFKHRTHSLFQRQYAIGLVADQNPGVPGHAFWLNFFGKPAPFVTGPEKGARKYDAAVFFARFEKYKRGYYRFHFTLVTKYPNSLPEGELTRLYRNFIEETIRQAPDNYLWTHNRFKWKYEGIHRGKWIDTSKEPGGTD